MTGTAAAVIGNIAVGKLNRSLLSHEIRKTTNAGKLFMVTEAALNRYVGVAKTLDPQEQADNLVLWVGDNQRTYDMSVETEAPPLAAAIGAAISGVNGGGAFHNQEPALYWLLIQLKDRHLFHAPPATHPSRARFQLTMGGWARYNELRHRVVTGRRAFMAMKFNDDLMSRVLGTCFKPAVQRAGFELQALNEGQGAGLIDDQMRVAIRTARFLIADLTHDNNGAYFEAGFAEGLGLPVIYTCERVKFEKEKTHFDTNHMVTVPWEADALEDAGRRLTDTIRATLPAEATLVDRV